MITSVCLINLHFFEFSHMASALILYWSSDFCIVKRSQGVFHTLFVVAILNGDFYLKTLQLDSLLGNLGSCVTLRESKHVLLYAQHSIPAQTGGGYDLVITEFHRCKFDIYKRHITNRKVSDCEWCKARIHQSNKCGSREGRNFPLNNIYTTCSTNIWSESPC